MRVFTRFLSIFLKEIDVLKAKTLKIFASGGSFLKEKKLTKSTISQSQKGAKQGGVPRNSCDVDSSRTISNSLCFYIAPTFLLLIDLN